MLKRKSIRRVVAVTLAKERCPYHLIMREGRDFLVMIMENHLGSLLLLEVTEQLAIRPMEPTNDLETAMAPTWVCQAR